MVLLHDAEKSEFYDCVPKKTSANIERALFFVRSRRSEKNIVLLPAAISGLQNLAFIAFSKEREREKLFRQLFSFALSIFGPQKNH